jgi:hypothetical protein
MRPRDVTKQGASRGRFPRPNLTMRELIGLVLAFALSNAFLSWMNHAVATNVVLFAFWNGMLALYLGFAFLQAWVRSVTRWMRTGHADPPARRPPRWTALGVAEATVIGGTMFGCSVLMLEKARGSTFGGDDWAVPATILLIGTAGGIIVLRTMRRERGDSLTGVGVEPTIEVGPKIEHGETG